MTSSKERKTWVKLLATRPDALMCPRFCISDDVREMEHAFYKLTSGANALNDDEAFVFDWELRAEDNGVLFTNFSIQDGYVERGRASSGLDLIPQKFVVTAPMNSEGNDVSVNFFEINRHRNGKWASDKHIRVTVASSVSERVVPLDFYFHKGHLELDDASKYPVSLEVIKNSVEVQLELLNMVQQRYLANYGPVLVDAVSLSDAPNKVKRVGNAPLFSYSRVAIQRQLTRVATGGSGTHASPRWHTRRGHWRNYKSGKRVWVDQTEVGDKSKGVVVKDYLLT